MRKVRLIEERFLEKVLPEPNSGCWLWDGALTDFGYGVLGRGGRGEGLVRAHRLAWELYKGPIPSGLQVLHKCDVACCVNVNHLYLGSQADNMLDVSDRQRARNASAKIDRHVAGAIRKLREAGVAPSIISAAFELSPRHVRKIVSHDRWRHV